MIGPLGQAKQLDQVGLGVEVFEQEADALQILHDSDIFKKVRAPAHDQALAVGALARPGGQTFGNDAGGQLVKLRAPFLDLLLDTGTGLRQGEPGNACVDIV